MSKKLLELSQGQQAPIPASAPRKKGVRLAFRFLALACLLSFAACGDDSPSGKQESPSEPSTVNCLVNGVEFQAGSGKTVVINDKAFEVCSEGCRYQLRRAPDEFLSNGSSIENASTPSTPSEQGK